MKISRTKNTFIPTFRYRLLPRKRNGQIYPESTTLSRNIRIVCVLIPSETWPLKASPADIRKVRVSACAQKTPNLRCWFLKQRLANTPRRHRLADGQLSSLSPPSPSFSSFGAAFVMCCSATPACSSTVTSLRPYVHYSSISLVVNIMFIHFFCDHLNVLYILGQTDVSF